MREIYIFIIFCFLSGQQLIAQNFSKVEYKVVLDSVKNEKIKTGKNKLLPQMADDMYASSKIAIFSLIFGSSESYFKLENEKNISLLNQFAIAFNLPLFYTSMSESKFVAIYGSTNVLYPKDYHQWTIHADKEKKIGKYTCKMAIRKRGKVNFIAWFCPDIPIASGPGKYFGLPGLILEVSNPGHFSIYATKISLNDPSVKSIPKYQKGKEVNISEVEK